MRRQRSSRRRDRFLACFVALVVTIGALTAGAQVFAPSTHVARH